MPLRETKRSRLDKEEAEQTRPCRSIERALVYVDDSGDGRLAAALAGMFAARQDVLTTVLEPPSADAAAASRDRLVAAFNGVVKSSPSRPRARSPLPCRRPRPDPGTLGGTDEDVRTKRPSYGIAFVGIAQPMASNVPRF